MWGTGSFGREQAEKCQPLAKSSSDSFTRERFLKLARAYLRPMPKTVTRSIVKPVSQEQKTW